MTEESAIIFFKQISDIPRITHHCEKIADYLVSFAGSRGLEYSRDGSCNVIIKKPAAKGFENAPAVMLQGHTDMVGDKHPDSKHDFLCDGIKLIEKDGFFSADGTTLGADDGCAVALMLALLDDAKLSAPPLECVFSADEEDGLDGAAAIDLSGTRAKYLINLDSEDEGVFTCGCAGGARLDIELPLKVCNISGNCVKIELSGLHGGHSAEEIANGRLNAAKLLCRLLSEAETEYIISLESGARDNAIPHCGTATVIGDIGAVQAAADAMLAECQKAEPTVGISVSDMGKYSGTAAVTGRAAEFIEKLPCGVQKMSDSVPGAVDTSDNLGILKISDMMTAAILARSASEERKFALCDSITKLCESYGGKCTVSSAYPGWEYRENSVLRPLMCRTYRELFGRDAKVEVIHAGLECGILLSKRPELDIVSCGPDTFGIHTYNEKLDIQSYKRLVIFIEEILKRIGREI